MTSYDNDDTEQTLQFDESKMAELLRKAKRHQKKACFLILGGLDVGSIIHIDKSAMVIGRAEDCDLVLRDYNVSRRHVEVRRKGASHVLIKDLGSTNGTFLDGESIHEATLSEGEKVLLGRQTVLKFVLLDELEEAYQKQLFESSTKDALTGIFNRKYLKQKIVTDISLANRYSIPLSLLMLDIDHFKQFNDSYGHATGDRVLTQVARVIAESLRTNDLVARYGGEEFVVLAPGVDLEGGKVLGERIREVIESLSLTSADDSVSDLRITISIGSASVAGSVDVDEEKLMSEADKNLYKAKERGRNTVIASQIT